MRLLGEGEQVRDILTGRGVSSARVEFKLDPGWERCDKSRCARCHGSGCTRSVHVRIFEYDSSLARPVASGGRRGMMTETAWPMQVWRRPQHSLPRVSLVLVLVSP